MILISSRGFKTCPTLDYKVKLNLSQYPKDILIHKLASVLISQCSNIEKFQNINLEDYVILQGLF